MYMWHKDLVIGGDIAVAGEVTAWSKSWLQSFRSEAEYGLEIKIESATGTPNVQVDLELGNTEEDETGLVNTNFVIADGDTAIITITNEVNHIKGYNPTPAQYARLKLTGLTGNPADTVVTRCKIIRTK